MRWAVRTPAPGLWEFGGSWVAERECVSPLGAATGRSAGSFGLPRRRSSPARDVSRDAAAGRRAASLGLRREKVVVGGQLCLGSAGMPVVAEGGGELRTGHAAQKRRREVGALRTRPRGPKRPGRWWRSAGLEGRVVVRRAERDDLADAGDRVDLERISLALDRYGLARLDEHAFADELAGGVAEENLAGAG